MQNKNESVVIAVMGATGAGKSTFVNLVTGGGGSDAQANDHLESSTEKIAAAKPFILDGRSVTLVDTPGFDQTEIDAAQTLRRISEFLSNSYKGGRKLNGILFFCRISDHRVGRAAQGDFLRFRRLCGEETLKNVVFVTTMWDTTPSRIAAQRERELARRPEFFKSAIDRGAQLTRHYNTIESAHHILRIVLGFPPELLRIQRELVDEGKALSETSAGMSLFLEAKFIEGLARIKEEAEAKIRERDELRLREVQAVASQLEDVRVAFGRLELEKRKLEEELGAEREKSRRLTEELGRRDDELRRDRAAREAEREAAVTLRETEMRNHDEELRRIQVKNEAEATKAREESEKHDRERLALRMELERLQREEAAARRKAFEDALRHDEDRKQDALRHAEDRKKQAVVGGLVGFAMGVGAVLQALM